MSNKDQEPKYAIIVTCQEVKSPYSDPVTGKLRIVVPEGRRSILYSDPWGVTSAYRLLEGQPRTLPNLKLFDSEEEAQDFTVRWKPHPWHVIPKSFEVVAVTPVTEPRVIGYEIKNQK